MVQIRLLTPNDIDYVAESVEREKWGHTRSDVKRCYQYEPEGCFIAESDSKPVGHVFSVGYGKLGWIGLLIVDKDQRGKGVGLALMKTAIDYLQKARVQTIKLEAVPAAIPLYKQLGFVEEFDSLRLKLDLKTPQANIETKPNTVRPMKKSDLQKVATFDSVYFGADRNRVLTQLFNDYPQHCFVAENNKDIAGYIMARETTVSYLIAPWVCNPKCPNAAAELFWASRNTIGTRFTELRIGTPATNTTATSLLHSLGFQTYSKSIRMRLGEKLAAENIEGVFGIAGPHKG